MILLIPMAFEMLAERATGHNLFSTFGGVPELVARGGIIRAQGPFGNSILAGSIAASSLPLTFVLWHGHRVVAIAGIGACILMVYSSYSSGPILSTGFGILALAMWPLRMHMRTIRWLAFLGYFALELLMSAPVYFLIARMDVTGSSTAWHRAELIDAAIKHFSEWWLVGTDYTRHWMPYGIEWSPAHVDITNYYIQMGVYGGISLMLLFIAILVRGFAFVGQVATQEGETDTNQAFVAWGLGAALFVHAATFMSVSYFDQSAVFLYLNLAAISTIRRSFARTPLSQQDQNRTGSLHTQK